MKRIVFALTIAMVRFCAFFNASAQTEEKPKEMFREETMRKFSVNNTTVQLGKGTVWVFDYSDVKVHAYETKDFFDTSVLFKDKKGKGVLIEVPPVSENGEELIDYIVGLGHKNIELIVSYHPISGKFVETDKLNFKMVYSMKHAVDATTPLMQRV